MASRQVVALHQAVLQGNLSYLLEAVTPRNVNYADPQHHLTLLLWAIALGRLPTVLLLLSRQAAIFVLDRNGFSALHRAVWSGDCDVVRALLFLSPQTLNAQDRRQQHNNTTVSQTQPSTLHRTWRPGAERLVNMAHVPTGRTPLMLAAIRGQTSMLAMLIDECGASLLDRDANSLTALDLAALSGQEQCMQMLYARMQHGNSHTRAICREVQRRVEEYQQLAKTVAQRNTINEINRMLIVDVAAQTCVAPM